MKTTKLLPLIGIAIFVYMLWNADLGTILANLQNVDPVLLFVAILILIPIVVTKAIKWKMLIGTYGISFPILKSTVAWTIGFAIGMITPARVGDMTRAYYIRKRMSLGKALTTVVIDKIIDVFILFLLALVGIAIFVSIFSGLSEMAFIIFVFFALFIVIIMLFVKQGVTQFVLKPIFRALVPEKMKPKLSALFHEFYDGVKQMSKKKGIVAGSTIVGIISWLLTILQYYFLSWAMGFNISYQYLAIIIPIVLLFDALPISFSGIGTREALMVFFFSIITLSAEAAISFSLMIFVVNYMLIGVVGLLFWTKNRL